MRWDSDAREGASDLIAALGDPALEVDPVALQQAANVVSESLRWSTDVHLRGDQPATADLIEAYTICVAVVVALQSRFPDARAVDTYSFCLEVHDEIVAWLTGKAIEVSCEAIFAQGDGLVKQGAMTTAEVVRVAAEARKRSPGRPVTQQRRIAREALDARRARALSWSQLAREFCSCQRSEHVQSCTDRLRKQVLELGDFLSWLSRWRKQVESFLHGDNPT